LALGALALAVIIYVARDVEHEPKLSDRAGINGRSSLSTKTASNDHGESHSEPSPDLPPMSPAPTSEQPAEYENPIGMTLKRIPAGEFLMGSPADREGAEDDEKPQHSVRITRDFYLGVYEVTQAQYKDVMDNNASWFSATGGGKDIVAGLSTDRHPVENVSWLDAVKFCNRLGAMEGLAAFYEIDGETVRVPDRARAGYRLPTEAEWEYACRAGKPTEYSFGDDASVFGSYAWFSGNSDGASHPVGEKSPNGFGLYDMHGNVWEWCSDWYDDGYYQRSPLIDPPGGSGASSRVSRGGGWSSDPRFARSANRVWFVPGDRDFNPGFRVALVPSGR
jgi:formylglycine-generating enzyme required for sulfatase activity